MLKLFELYDMPAIGWPGVLYASMRLLLSCRSQFKAIGAAASLMQHQDKMAKVDAEMRQHAEALQAAGGSSTNIPEEAKLQLYGMMLQR